MTSKTSSRNPFLHTFKYSLKGRWILGLVMSTMFTLMYCNDIITTLIEYNDYIKTGQFQLAESLKENGCFEFQYFSDGFEYLISFFMVLYAVFIAISLFSFMINKNSTNVFFSLGISREKLFAAKYLAGAVLMVYPPFVALLLAVILNISFYGPSLALWVSATYFVIKLSSAMLLSFTLMIFVMTQLGSIFESIVYFVVLLLSPLLLSEAFSTFLGTLVYGSPYYSDTMIFNQTMYMHDYQPINFVFRFFDFSKYVFPVASDCFSNCGAYVKVKPDCNDYIQPQFKWEIVFLIFIAVLAIITGILFSKRKTEKAGFMGSSPFLLGYSVISVGAFLTSVFLFDFEPLNIPFNMLFKTILLGALIMTLGYLVVSIIFVRSFKGIKKRLPHLFIEIGVFVVLILGIFVFGNAQMKRLPEAERVKSAAVSVLPYGSNYGLYGEYKFYDDKLRVENLLTTYIETTFLTDGFKEKQEIETILKVNEKLKTPGGADTRRAEVRIIYNLKNGKQVSRKYHVATNEIWQELAVLTNTETYRKTFCENISNQHSGYIPYSEENTLVSLISPNFARATAVYGLSNQETSKILLNAIIKDIKQGNYSFIYGDKKPLGYIVFGYRDNPLPNKSDFKADINLLESNDYKSFWSDSRFIVLTEEMENTLDFLSKTGYMLYFKEEILPVRIAYYENTFDECGLLHFDSYNAVTAKIGDKISNNYPLDPDYYEKEYEYYDLYSETMFGIDKLANRNAMPDNSTVLTDKTEIKDFLEKVRLISFSFFDGYFVQLEYPDGSFVYCYAVK